ncbi:thioredoxin-disulfide reductase [Bacillota bacterium LX-D]|nr:thioredoxin-disulfide reductase [Bacillota bacterium LX-D]
MDFSKIKNIAVVGISKDEKKPSHFVAKYMQEAGYRIIPVNPTIDEVLGEKSYPDLLHISSEIKIDVVDIFRRAEDVGPIVDQAIARKVPVIWMQQGIVNEEAAGKARGQGIEVVMDRCLKVAHKEYAMENSANQHAVYDLIILGGGPAGLTAGMYGARGGLKTMLLEMGMPGGQATNTERIENYPGFPEGISGMELMQRFMEQSQKFALEIKMALIKKTDLKSNPKRIVTDVGEFLAKAVIIASGARPKKLFVPGEEKFQGFGVSYCATCDGAFFKDKKVMVVGGGNSALEEAAFLTKFAREVIIVHRRNQFRATHLIQMRTRENPKLSYKFDTVIEEILGDNKVEKVRMKNVKTGLVTEENTDGVFIFIGTEPNTGFLQNQVKLDEFGYVVVDSNLNCSLPGVFAAGDVRQKSLRQVSTAVGDGAVAAVSAEKYLAGLE